MPIAGTWRFSSGVPPFAVMTSTFARLTSETHVGRTLLDPGASPLGRVLFGFGNDGESGLEGCRLGRAIGTYLHGPLLPRNPWLADWLLAPALAHATGGDSR